MFLLNTLLALIWMIFQNSFSPVDFLVGFLLGFIVITMTQQTMGIGDYSIRTWHLLQLVVFVLWTIVVSSIAMAHIVAMPVAQVRPGIVAVPLDLQGDMAISILAHIISLIPGTISLDISREKRTLYVHTISITNPETFRQTIKQELEQRVARIFREREP